MEFDLEQAQAILQRTPATLRALLGGLAPAWTAANEGPQTFSPFDVVGHLIDGEETDWIPRARLVLEHGEAQPFETFDRFRHQRLNRGKSLAELLETFATLRAANLQTLRDWRLTAAQLDRTGIHPELGRVTLRQHLSTWTVHDLDHIAQVARVMAKQYTPNVGAWRAYLPILK